ncbi:HTH-type transcriptional regulator BhcR [Hoeflea poritis]|uniref:IclR family transcriptional regulator n=1 Tax=Hoeflea poritis TaxID=2993659 RepID=A0ABT4VJC2_9HYPH|nr:HTH-type transcriptional regulator BhcR [Hoeflea poritis]MDA4844275.1 IclR family transcriptional regulator [Hoeflea poritis]
MSDTVFTRARGRPRGRPTNKPVSNVKALERALVLLRTVAEADSMSLTDLSQRAGMPASTAHRLLMTLQNFGYLEFNEDTQLWTIGVEAFRIGGSFVRRIKVVEAGRPMLRTLMEQTGETANMAVADDGDVVFVSQIETHEPIRAFHRPGTRAHMHASGIGKALLAHLDDAGLDGWMAKKGLPIYTQNTIANPEKLRGEMAAIRERGWAIDNEERTLGMRCVAAPVYNEYGEAIAGVSVSGPTVRIPDSVLTEYGILVRQSADEITRSIGGTAPAR